MFGVVRLSHHTYNRHSNWYIRLFFITRRHTDTNRTRLWIGKEDVECARNINDPQKITSTSETVKIRCNTIVWLDQDDDFSQFYHCNEHALRPNLRSVSISAAFWDIWDVEKAHFLRIRYLGAHRHTWDGSSNRANGLVHRAHFGSISTLLLHRKY